MWKLILSRTDQEVSGVPPDNFGCPIEQVLSHDQPPPSYWQWSTLGGVQGLVLRDQFVPDLVLSRRAGLRQEGGTPSSDHLRVSFNQIGERSLVEIFMVRQLSCLVVFDDLKFWISMELQRSLFGDKKLGEPKNLISNNIDWWDVIPQQCSVCLKDKIPTFSETHWSTAPFSESETFRREKKVDLHYAICILCN